MAAQEKCLLFRTASDKLSAWVSSAIGLWKIALVWLKRQRRILIAFPPRDFAAAFPPRIFESRHCISYRAISQDELACAGL
jgi:hypothetical protein